MKTHMPALNAIHRRLCASKDDLVVMEAVTILLRAQTSSEQLKSPDTYVAPVASVKNGLTHQKICTSSRKNTALLNQHSPNQALQRTASSGSALLCLQPPLSWALAVNEAFEMSDRDPAELELERLARSVRNGELLPSGQSAAELLS